MKLVRIHPNLGEFHKSERSLTVVRELKFQHFLFLEISLNYSFPLFK